MGLITSSTWNLAASCLMTIMLLQAASRAGFQLQMSLALQKAQAEIVVVISAEDTNSNSVRDRLMASPYD